MRFYTKYGKIKEYFSYGGKNVGT
ncbi:hypothetical protein HMPREF0874_00650 [Veillonella sp. 6_1_27]|nr:hypothetical protein HMPREF0874_00650 [Veillonella sp. 6_1_27]